MTEERGRSTERLIVCGVAGSLRRGSYNRSLLRTAPELAPAEMEIRIFDRIAEIPLFNADVEAEGDPEPVQALKQAVAEADALLIATPEYNHGLLAVTKNLVDWASRPAGRSVLVNKPTAIMGATPGMAGTTRAQAALRQSLVTTRTPVLIHPQVLVNRARGKFDAQGRLEDEDTRDHIRALLEGLQEWTRRLLCNPGGTA